MILKLLGLYWLRSLVWHISHFIWFRCRLRGVYYSRMVLKDEKILISIHSPFEYFLLKISPTELLILLFASTQVKKEWTESSSENELYKFSKQSKTATTTFHLLYKQHLWHASKCLIICHGDIYAGWHSLFCCTCLLGVVIGIHREGCDPWLGEAVLELL